MAYVPQFKHDIFISFAHADDAADPQDVRWVSDFQMYLKRAVKQHLAGFEPDVFFDALDLHPNQSIKIVLAHARESALFLPIISPSYVERRWPNDELKAFSEVVAEVDRIFAVELLPPVGDYPPQLRDLKRKTFWWKDEKEGSAPRKFTPRYKSETYTEYVDDVAYLVAKRLRELHPQDALQRVNPSSIAGKTVMLAEVTDDLRRNCRQIRDHLEQYGVNVLPKHDYPDTGVEFVKLFNADLTQADVFVQLLSEVRSIRSPELKSESEAEPQSQGQYQYDTAKLRGIPILQWRSPETDPSTVTHWDQRLLAGPHVVAMGLGEFVKEIKRALDRPAPETDTSKKQRKGEILFINADRSDKELADKLVQAFEDNPEWMAVGPLFEGPADQILEDLEENLKECAALLLVYGNSTPPWVRAQLRRYNKLEKSRKESPRLKTILLGPPAPKTDRDLGASGIFTKIDCQNGITTEHLHRILVELRM
jgi:hypothetical protein